MKEGLKNLTLEGHIHIEVKRDREMVSLCKWTTQQRLEGIVRRQTLISTTKDMGVWGNISHILKGHD